MLTQRTSLTSQRAAFSLPEQTHYINCATRAPYSRAVENAGLEAIRFHSNPMGLRPDDFFAGGVAVRDLFARLINQPEPERVALIGSVSYGMAIVARNLHRKPGIGPGQQIVQIGEEFPSDVYAWDRVISELGLKRTVVPMPADFPKAEAWNAAILAAIDAAPTALVVVPPVHWMYGTRFDLEAIGQRARAAGALYVIDGTQAVGALPFDWQAIRPDALICAAYKWLMGPYSMGLACFGEFFDEGLPLEESWMNRMHSNQFHRLSEYEPTYRPKAYRYNIGEHSHFLQMPMLEAALAQLLDWQPERIQDYCGALLTEALPVWESLGCRIEPESGRGQHLVGVWLPDEAEPLAVQQALLDRRVSVSVRGRALRVAPHVYNEAADISALTEALLQLRMKN